VLHILSASLVNVDILMKMSVIIQ